jgi:hypothetical protein
MLQSAASDYVRANSPVPIALERLTLKILDIQLTEESRELFKALCLVIQVGLGGAPAYRRLTLPDGSEMATSLPAGAAPLGAAAARPLPGSNWMGPAIEIAEKFLRFCYIDRPRFVPISVELQPFVMERIQSEML